MENQVDFILNSDDMAEVLSIDESQEPSISKNIFQFIGTWVFIFFLFLAFGYFLGGKEKLMDPTIQKYLLGGWLMLAAVIMFCNIIEYLLLKLKDRKKTLINDKRIGTKFTFSWNENILSIGSGNVKGRYPWQLFYDFVEYPTFIAFYTSKKDFHILPKNALSELQLFDLRKVLLEEIRKIREKKKK